MIQPGHKSKRKAGGRKFSSLTFKILGVNLGAIFMLAFGFLYTAQYERELINAELTALSKETELISAAISEGGVRETLNENPYLARDLAQLMVRKISAGADFRILLFNNSGLMIADSHQLVGTGGVVEIIELDPPPHMMSWHVHLQKKASGYLGYLPTRLNLPPFPEINSDSIESFPYLLDTLRGVSTAQAWHTPDDNDIKLTVVQPVARLKQVLGGIMLIRPGDRIDSAIQSVQLNVIRVFLGTLAITIFLSLYLSTEIVSPIRALSSATNKLRFRQDGDGIPDLSERNDEIGDLSIALRDMTLALNARLQAIESFAADVAHELKNPLASVRSAVETLPKIKDRKKQDRLLEIIEQDVHRLDRLISDISAASRLDAELSRIEQSPFRLDELLATITTNYRDRDESTKNIIFTDRTAETENVVVNGDEGRLGQVFANLIDNALSFAAPDTTVNIQLERKANTLYAMIENEGVAIPESKLETIFQRFYTERPQSDVFGAHSGLGLSISKQIITAHNGRIWAENLPDESGESKFVRFTVALPAYD